MRPLNRIGLAVLLTALAAPAVVGAQGRGNTRPLPDRSDDRGQAQTTTRGYDEGFRQGQQLGEDHGRRGLSFNFGLSIEYRNGNFGYRPSYGNLDRYRGDFRIGFERGYRDSYGRFSRTGRGNAPWGNYGNYGNFGRADLAFDNGFRDGFDEGLEDGRRNHRFDPVAESRYRNGDHGYERWYGPANVYRNNYRDGFRSGYERGFSEGRRPW